MTYNDFISRLHGVRASGDGHVAICPAHDDRNASLSCCEKGGKILLKCHAGCSAAEIVGALGLTFKDLVTTPEAPRARGRIVATYDYTDKAGKLLFQVVRKEPKAFLQRRPDATKPGGWDWKRAGITPVPYCLPALILDSAVGSPVLILEGEKDVDRARALGFTATCNPGGAGKWQPGWGPYFAGAKLIVIVADRDKAPTGPGRPGWTGQRHALDVAAKLALDGVDRAKVQIAYAGDTDVVKDFSDWVESAGVAAGDHEKAKSALVAALHAGLDAFKRDMKETNGFTALPAATADGTDGQDGGAADGAPGAPSGAGDGGGGGGRVVSRYGEAFTTEDGRAGWYAIVGRARVEAVGEEPLIATILKARAEVKKWQGEGVKLCAELKKETDAAAVLLWLRCRGTFFYDSEDEHRSTAFYFDRARGQLFRIPGPDPKDVMGLQFRTWIATESYINQTTPAFNFIMSLLRDAGITDGVSTGTVPAKLWCRRGQTLYISCGDSNMYRVDKDGVKYVQNGTDGVVFLSRATLTPWTYAGRGNGMDPFKEALIFQSASFRSESDRMILRLWFLNALYDHAQKPPLLVTGGYGSGKTRTGLALKEIVGTSDRTVQQVEDGDKGCDSFWVVNNSGKLEVFDNFDQKIKWTNDAIQVAATNGAVKRRTLYTTQGMTVLRANSWLILTSNNPQFAAEEGSGLADRLQIVNLEQATRKTIDTALSEDIAKNRDRYLTWAVDSLSAALADTGELPPPCNRRHPDYADFSVRLGRACGFAREAIDALTAAELGKSVLPLKENAVAKEIVRCLLRHGGSWRFTAKEMSEDIVAHIENGDEKTAQVYSARKVGKSLAWFRAQIDTLFQVAVDASGAPRSPRFLQGTTVYEYTGVKAPMAAFGGFEVYKVDINGCFLEASTISRNPIVFENPYSKPTLSTSNPPISSSLEGGEGGEEIDNKENEPLSEDFEL